MLVEQRLMATAARSRESSASTASVYSARRAPLYSLAAGHAHLFGCATVSVNGRSRASVSKITCEAEATCYEQLMADALLRSFVPEHLATAPLDDEELAEAGQPPQPGTSLAGSTLIVVLEDVTAGCAAPCVMDIKLGTRTFLEAEAAGSAPRLDLAKKALEFAPAELSADERNRGISKLRYMALRDSFSTSHRLGCRIDGISLSPNRRASVDAPDVPAPLRALHTEAQLDAGLAAYFDACPYGWALRAAFCKRLEMLRDALESSVWLTQHECIGTSLLLVYDGSAASEEAAMASVQLKWVDFTKVAPSAHRLTHRAQWRPGVGCREDGLLLGVDGVLRKLRELPPTPPPSPPATLPPSPQHTPPPLPPRGCGR